MKTVFMHRVLVLRGAPNRFQAVIFTLTCFFYLHKSAVSGSEATVPSVTTGRMYYVELGNQQSVQMMCGAEREAVVK